MKTIYFKPLIFLAVWMMALVITSQARSQELVFVQVASMSGKDGADLGLGLQAGIKAYFEQVNRQGGVNGRPLKLVVVDDEYVPDKTVSLTEKAIKDHDPLALIGYRGTANTLALMKSGVMEKERIALVGTLTGAAAIQSHPFIFHTRTPYPSELFQVAQQVASIGHQRIAILHVDDGFGLSGLQSLQEALTKIKIKPVVIAKYDKAADKVNASLDAAVATLEAAKPDAILVVAVGEPVYEFVKRLRTKGSGAYVYLMSVVDPKLLTEKVGKEFAAGVGFSQVYPYPFGNPVLPLLRDYRAALERSSPGLAPTYFSLEGYVNARVLVNALRRIRGPITRATLLDALRNQGTIDLGGLVLEYTPKKQSGSSFIELTILDRQGRLLK